LKKIKKYLKRVDKIVTQHYNCVVIPKFLTNGKLPPGIHSATWKEICERFGHNSRRLWLMEGLEIALKELNFAGCKIVFIDGSFVTSKLLPNDYDLCWSIEDVNPSLLNPVILDFTNHRAAMRDRYRGDLFPAECPEGITGLRFLDFFQMDKDTGKQKGIISLVL
jgi:hypothetical protein